MYFFRIFYFFWNRSRFSSSTNRLNILCNVIFGVKILIVIVLFIEFGEIVVIFSLFMICFVVILVGLASALINIFFWLLNASRLFEINLVKIILGLIVCMLMGIFLSFIVIVFVSCDILVLVCLYVVNLCVVASSFFAFFMLNTCSRFVVVFIVFIVCFVYNNDLSELVKIIFFSIFGVVFFKLLYEYLLFVALFIYTFTSSKVS